MCLLLNEQEINKISGEEFLLRLNTCQRWDSSFVLQTQHATLHADLKFVITTTKETLPYRTKIPILLELDQKNTIPRSSEETNINSGNSLLSY